MKPLPSMKEKKRYLVIKVFSKNKFSKSMIIKSLKENFKTFFGLMSLSKASIMVLGERFNDQNQTIMIKVSNKYVEELVSSLILIKEIEGSKVSIKSLICSGTIKKAALHL